MVSATYRKKLFRLKHLWFADIYDALQMISNTTDADLIYIHGIADTDIPNAVRLGTQHTLIKQLDDDPDAVFQTFGKHLRKFIQRSIGEGTIIRHFEGEEIDEKVLNACMNLYNKMKEDKGVSGTFNTDLAREYVKSGNLLVSLAFVGETVVGFKASIIDKTNLRAWVSAFSFRDGIIDAHVISRAHQLLEWEIMRTCCHKGISTLDFGGIYSFDEPNGIDTFKMSLAKEGLHVTYHNYLVGTSLLGKLIVLGYKILKKLRK